MTMTKLREWLRLSTYGDQLEYYRGRLDTARLKDEGVNQIAKEAVIASQLKFVRLMQQRHGKDDYSYLMVRR